DLHDVASALATNPVPTPELERARDRILASWLAERETASGIARILGDGAVVHGDPGHSDKELAELLAATPESVRAAAAQLFRKENRTVVVATRGKANVPASRDGAAAKAPKETPPAPNEKPPAPGAPRPAAPLSLRSARMDNGLRFIGAPKPGTGLVTLGIVVPGGAAHDPSGKAGLADMAADLLLRGTKTRSAQRIAEEAESLGGMLEAGADRDTVSLSITVPAARLAPALALLADVVRNPVFAPDEVARVRGARRSLAGIDLQDPGEIAGSVLRRLLYGNSGYGNRVQGTPASIARIDQAGCIAWHAGTFHPALTTLVVVGDVDDDAMQRAAESTFASWNARGPAPRRRPLPKVPPIQRRVVLVDNPDSGQAAVRVGRPGMARNDPDFATAMLANSVLGGGFSSRLNKIIRIERGLAYGAMSVLAAQRGAGPLVLAAQTRDDAAAKVAGLMVATLERLPLDPLSPAELAARKSALVGPMLRLMETGAGTAGELLGLAGLGIPLEETTALAERINTVGGDAVRAVVRRRLAANVASVVVVGDRRKCHAELRGRFGHVDVVPARTLDVGTYPPD
ncbi:MAG: insulinase family protein, partial [Armatimonadota bacterium]